MSALDALYLAGGAVMSYGAIKVPILLWKTDERWAVAAGLALFSCALTNLFKAFGL